MTPYDNGRGYLVINLKLTTGYRCHGISELVLRAFVGPRPAPHYQAAHANGRRHDNRLHNLRWATPKENDADKDIHGTRRFRPVRLSDGLETLRCTRCDEWLPRSSFRPLPGGRPRGRRASSWCRGCEKSTARDRKRKLRAAARYSTRKTEGDLDPPHTANTQYDLAPDPAFCP